VLIWMLCLFDCFGLYFESMVMMVGLCFCVCDVCLAVVLCDVVILMLRFGYVWLACMFVWLRYCMLFDYCGNFALYLHLWLSFLDDDCARYMA
jgi:hypothetical protein